ncbi:MAG: hypothetical protein KDB07_05365, partial [Planctomycetes bacterium]|nr:hypothetical protein [Planctomycetota bacterium]
MRKPISFALAIVAMAAFFGSATSPVIAEQAKPSAPQMVDNMDDDGEVGEAGAEKKASAESAQKGPEAARKIYEDIQAIGKAVSEAANKGNAAIGAIKDPQSEEGRAERAKIIADFNTFRDSEFKKRGELQEKLGKVFAEIEFKDWDLEKDKSLVSNCLYMMGTEAMEKEPAKAMDHLEMILEEVPGERHDATIRTRLLPNLYIQHDNYDAAK